MPKYSRELLDDPMFKDEAFKKLLPIQQLDEFYKKYPGISLTPKLLFLLFPWETIDFALTRNYESSIRFGNDRVTADVNDQASIQRRYVLPWVTEKDKVSSLIKFFDSLANQDKMKLLVKKFPGSYIEKVYNELKRRQEKGAHILNEEKIRRPESLESIVVKFTDKEAPAFLGEFPLSCIRAVWQKLYGQELDDKYAHKVLSLKKLKEFYVETNRQFNEEQYVQNCSLHHLWKLLEEKNNAIPSSLHHDEHLIEKVSNLLEKITGRKINPFDRREFRFLFEQSKLVPNATFRELDKQMLNAPIHLVVYAADVYEEPLKWLARTFQLIQKLNKTRQWQDGLVQGFMTSNATHELLEEDERVLRFSLTYPGRLSLSVRFNGVIYDRSLEVNEDGSVIAYMAEGLDIRYSSVAEAYQKLPVKIEQSNNKTYVYYDSQTKPDEFPDYAAAAESVRAGGNGYIYKKPESAPMWEERRLLKKKEEAKASETHVTETGAPETEAPDIETSSITGVASSSSVKSFTP